MNNIDKLINDFYRIKELGFVPSTRTNNIDGGIGNTFEDLLGIKENNLSMSDYLDFEIKSKRELNTSYISLFSKSPSFPKGANSLLREKYGEIRDADFAEKKKLYASVFAHRYSRVYNKYKMKLKVDYSQQLLFLNIFNQKSKLLDFVYWTFQDLEKASNKIKSLILVTAEVKEISNLTHFHFNNAELYLNFSFDNFLKSIKSGGIMFDIRIGVYNSGKNKGKTHDHGSGFRIKKENFKNIYSDYKGL